MHPKYGFKLYDILFLSRVGQRSAQEMTNKRTKLLSNEIPGNPIQDLSKHAAARVIGNRGRECLDYDYKIWKARLNQQLSREGCYHDALYGTTLRKLRTCCLHTVEVGVL
jgi:hypothetical protein